VEKSTRLDRLDRLVDDFSINSTRPIFDRLDRLHRSTTGSIAHNIAQNGSDNFPSYPPDIRDIENWTLAITTRASAGPY